MGNDAARTSARLAPDADLEAYHDSSAIPPPPQRLARPRYTIGASSGNDLEQSGDSRLSVTRVSLIVVALVLAVAGTYALFRAFDERSAPPIVIEDAAATFPIAVEVRGAVTSPGVYELPAGSRVQDAILAAGGMTASADRSTVNLARRLRDGEVAVVAEIPEIVFSPVESTEGEGSPNGVRPDGRININTATADELVALPGVGEVTAERIVAFREEHGPYRSADDLVHVQGISSGTIDGLRDLVATAP